MAQGNTIGSGQGQRVLIRGLSQNVVLLNEDIFVTGLELFTFGEGNDRNTDSLEGIPADLLGGVDVFKSPNASLLEGGMGGIVNLRTRSPFDFEGTTLAANVRYGMQDHADEWTPIGTIVGQPRIRHRLRRPRLDFLRGIRRSRRHSGRRQPRHSGVSATAPIAPPCRPIISRRSIAT